MSRRPPTATTSSGSSSSLPSRLIDQVDDATRAAVKAKLAIYPQTPVPVLQKLGLVAAQEGRRVPLAREIAARRRRPRLPAPPTEAELRMAANMAMQPKEAAEIHDMFFARRCEPARADPAQSGADAR